MRFAWQVYCGGLPFLYPVDYVLSELSSLTHPFSVALLGMVHSFIELFICHGKAVIHEGGLHKPVDEGKIGVWKSKLKTKKKKKTKKQTNKQKKTHSIQSHYIMANRRGKCGSNDRFFSSWALKSLHMVTAAMEWENDCFLAEKLWQT